MLQINFLKYGLTKYLMSLKTKFWNHKISLMIKIATIKTSKIPSFCKENVHLINTTNYIKSGKDLLVILPKTDQLTSVYHNNIIINFSNYFKFQQQQQIFVLLNYQYILQLRLCNVAIYYFGAMFYDSQSQLSNDEEQFVFYAPSHITHEKKKSKTTKSIQSIRECCLNLQNQILGRMMREKAERTVNDIASNITSSKSIIVPIQIKRNQIDQLPQYIKNLNNILQNPYKHFKQHDRLIISQIPQREVRDIILSMFIRLTQPKQQPNAITIFVVTEITDLSQTNLYIFQKALENQRFIIVIPTYCNLENYVSDRGTQSQVQLLYHHLFSAKDAFAEYMFECLTSKQIKAYLPKQTVSFITDYDYYPLSFREGARRLDYCIQKVFVLLKKEKNFVEFKNVTDLIENQIKKLHLNHKYIESKEQQNLITCILDEKAVYRIPNLVIQQMYKFSYVNSEDCIIQDLRNSIIKKFNKDESLKKYVDFLQGKTTNLLNQPQKKHYKKSRADLLGIDSKLNLSEQSKLQDQLTLIIHSATIQIRKQASEVTWKQINFQNRVVPQIPRLITTSIQNMSENHKKLKEILTKCYSISLEQLFIENQFTSLRSGQLMFLLRDLQLSGIIDRNRKSSKMSYINNFYEKAKFSKI